MRTTLAATRETATAFACAALVSGCRSTTELHVIDPRSVTVGVDDAEHGRVELPVGDQTSADARVAVGPRYRNDACGADRPVPLRLRREASGAIHIDTPALRGHTEAEVVSADGSASVWMPALRGPTVGWDDHGRELVLRSAYTCTALTRPRQSEIEIDAFDVWMRTPRENVERVVTREKPERELGWILLVASAPFALGAAMFLTSRDESQQKFGAFILGPPALVLGGGGALLLAMPERVTSEFP